MAHQLAQAGERHARFGQLAGIGVAQLVRGHVLANGRPIPMQQPFDAVRRQRTPMLIEKDMRLRARRPLSQPGPQHRIGIRAEQDHALLPPFAAHAQPGWLLTLGWD